MRKSFRRAAFSRLRSLFKQRARKDHDPGVDGRGVARAHRNDDDRAEGRDGRQVWLAIFCESDFIEGDVIRWKEAVWEKRGPKQGGSVRIGDRLLGMFAGSAMPICIH